MRPDRSREAARTVCALLLVAGAACGDASQVRTVPVSAVAEERALVPEVFFTSDSLGSPRALTVAGGLLVVGDGLGRFPLWIVSRESPRRHLPFGRRGSGPAEIRSPWSLATEPSGDAVWVYDMGMRRMSRVDVSTDRPAVTRTFLVNVPQPVTGPQFLSDSTFASPGFLAAGRVAEFDTRGNPVRSFGPVPPGDPDIPAHVRQHAYQSTLRVKPDRSRVVLATRHADQLEIYGAGGELVRTVKGPSGFTPAYESRRRGVQEQMVSSPDLRFGYISLAVTDRWIIALYSGHSRRERPGWAHYGDVLHVFDWDGTLRRVLPLSFPSLAIAVDPGGRTLYAARENPVPAVLRYPLPLPR
jgi:hypothetical protein